LENQRQPMDDPAEFSLQTSDQDAAVAVLTGDWTAVTLGSAGADLARAVVGLRKVEFDLTQMDRMDTAGAFAVIRTAGDAFDMSKIRARPETLRLLELVENAHRVVPEPIRRLPSFRQVLERIGKGVIDLASDGWDTIIFAGHLLAVMWLTILHPSRLRIAACVALAERAGLDAIPIVATTSFFIGAVVGLLGADMLQQFGAEVFAVELIGIAVLREFSIIITAVLLAGRSASSFAAEIGAMKMNQEIDAMKVMGVDPFEALVFPRFVAMLVTIPLLTFVATIAGLLGGLVVTWSALGLGPAFFIQRLVDNVGYKHFLVGLSKAPVMAVVIAGIGCRQGMEVGNDVESLGRRVTSAVVHAIFAIILIDAVFALVYMKADI
jgi:phospholipid/cholesterol/gamma-HCH transport system permease protein